MSDFFENLGNAAKRAVSNVSMEVNVAALEQKIKDAQRIIGQLYCDAMRNGTAPVGPEFDQQVQTIARLQAEIADKRRSNEI